METKKAVNEIINIGSNDEKRVIDVAKVILKELKIKKNIIKRPAPVGSANRRKPDISKLKKLINWYPKTTLKVGIKKLLKI